MVGLLRADSGRVRVMGDDITGYDERSLIGVRKALSMVFQSAALFDSLSVYENVAYPLREHRKFAFQRTIRSSTAALRTPSSPRAMRSLRM